MSTYNIPFSIYKKNTPGCPRSAVADFFQGSQIRARDGCGGRAVSIRTTVGLLYREIYSTGVIMKSIP